MKRNVTFDGGRWSNADADRIGLSEPDPRWPALFAAEAGSIRAALDADPLPRIEHVGSTAVPGLAAKPIIDMLLIPEPEADWSRFVDPLESLGYVYWAENPRTDRMFFVKGMPPHGPARTHHVHVRRSSDAADALLFRDHLIGHADVAARYEALKRELAERHPTDREAYTSGKGAFVETVLKSARAARERTDR